ncbi:hypothetical protein AXF42_Ash018392 [Apostasia shenzhenica]|uniref:Uncharacterized protein n=1 Tax=Apostasia shenzhenica TaxID=1088818 RepID=A0A2I0BE74_9ASPA|nr:hypothetical protein AXF42_Ash018392 [Apostasia shenzhenica]
MFSALPATSGTTFPSSPQTSMTTFLSYIYYCQRALAAPFPMQHASSSHANQGLTSFSHHGPQEDKLFTHYFQSL